MDKVKILITGGNGYIAKSLYSAFSTQYRVTSITRNDFDLCDYSKTCSWFEGKQFDVVIHTAISGGSRLQQDDQTVFDKNMSMFTNLFANKHHFSKLISFGSGAELFHGNTPYANSKREIAKQILELPNFYNLRLFGVFDHNELNTRFIKSNIIRHIKKQPMIIHENKVMDFFYMPDLISVVDYFIFNKKLLKQINCCYKEKYDLKNIANIINTIDKYQVPILIENKNKINFYCGNSELPIIPIGLFQGIKETYLKLKVNYE